jgi:hypothetical protein
MTEPPTVIDERAATTGRGLHPPRWSRSLHAHESRNQHRLTAPPGFREAPRAHPTSRRSPRRRNLQAAGRIPPAPRHAPVRTPVPGGVDVLALCRRGEVNDLPGRRTDLHRLGGVESLCPVGQYLLVTGAHGSHAATEVMWISSGNLAKGRRLGSVQWEQTSVLRCSRKLQPGPRGASELGVPSSCAARSGQLQVAPGGPPVCA